MNASIELPVLIQNLDTTNVFSPKLKFIFKIEFKLIHKLNSKQLLVLIKHCNTLGVYFVIFFVIYILSLIQD